MKYILVEDMPKEKEDTHIPHDKAHLNHGYNTYRQECLEKTREMTKGNLFWAIDEVKEYRDDVEGYAYTIQDCHIDKIAKAILKEMSK